MVSDRKSTRLNSSHLVISYAVFCLKKKKNNKKNKVRGVTSTADVRVRGSHGVLSLSVSLFRPTPTSLAFSCLSSIFFFFFFNDPAPPEIYPLPLPAALPISTRPSPSGGACWPTRCAPAGPGRTARR